MSSGSGINFDEPIPKMIKRLEMEHEYFESKLVEVKTNIDANNVTRAAGIIRSISEKIIRHAVEEEARLMRVIMHKAKEESTESIMIMQEHNWVMNFLKNRMDMVSWIHQYLLFLQKSLTSNLRVNRLISILQDAVAASS